MLNMDGDHQMHTQYRIGMNKNILDCLQTIIVDSLFISYYPRSNEFSDLLSKTGMYRNYSLNTVMDKSRV